MRNFRNLKIWNDGMDTVVSVYNFASGLPSEEKFGIKSQICRAAVSIPSNIAEGSSRTSDLEFKRFLEISIGSSFELETQILFCKRLGIATEEQIEEQLTKLNSLQKQINQLISKIKNDMH